ncbi:uncharacterized protein LOC135260617 isoform X9 [Anguilla rostrata]|uniref:uncharacterized protein LOC135260617 isoform X9 n=1 Tax=Anguilla rostrata TaxID=7938 RepID=UPI0030CE47ED
MHTQTLQSNSATEEVPQITSSLSLRLKMLVLLVSTLPFSVSRAEESLSLFVRKGGSVRLDVQGYEKLRNEALFWRFNSTAILQYLIKFKDLTFYKDYKIRTEFDQKNFTLLLKNVQERDSGIYTAKITDIEGQPRDVASYRLTVQVSRAEESLFVRKGGSVHLDVQEKLQNKTLFWYFSSTAILQYNIKFKHLKFYEDYNIRTVFDQKNFTLLLKNVQERDSGIYTAVIIDDEGEKRDVASYRLTVQVSGAEESLFVRKGGSVRLDVQRHERLRFDSLFWHFNISTAVLVYINKFKDLKLCKDYKSRTEFDQRNFSLLLKNVRLRHSGTYTATISDKSGQQILVASYRLTVQVAPPTPQVRVVFLSSAGGFCKVSVNCSAKDTWASYTCDHAQCTQVANTASPTGVNIIVTATNGTIHCSSSNRVDTKTGSESTKTICPVPPVTPSPGLSLCALKSVLFSLGLVAMVSAVIAVNVRERCCRDQSGLRENNKSVRGEERINI